MTFHLVLDTHSVVRLSVALVLSGGVLLLLARLLFGPLPGGRD